MTDQVPVVLVQLSALPLSKSYSDKEAALVGRMKKRARIKAKPIPNMILIATGSIPRNLLRTN